MMSDIHHRVLGILEDFGGMKPETDESWESWYHAAFDLAFCKIDAQFDMIGRKCDEAALALQNADWSHVSIGNKALIQNAIERLGESRLIIGDRNEERDFAGLDRG